MLAVVIVDGINFSVHLLKTTGEGEARRRTRTASKGLLEAK
jgi:hypothetical protein